MIHASDHYVKSSGVKDLRDGTLLTSANATLKLIVTDKAATTTQAEVPMTYVSAGIWEYTVPGASFVLGADPWTVEVRVYNQAGTLLQRVIKIRESDGY